MQLAQLWGRILQMAHLKSLNTRHQTLYLLLALDQLLV